MNEAPRYVTFRDYLRVARERRVLILVITVLFAGSALVYSARQDPVYRAEASIEFLSLNTVSSQFGQTIDVGGQTPEQRAAVAASTLVRPAVTKRAAEILKNGATGPGIAALVTARAEARTQLVIVQARGLTAKRAAETANAVAQAAVEVTRDETRKQFADAADAQRAALKKINRKKPGNGLTIANLQASITRSTELSKVASPATVRRTADPPGSPYSPKPVRNTLLGLLIGLTLGLVGAFLRDSLDRRFKTSHEITDELHLPLIGHVPEDALGRTLIEGGGRQSLPESALESFRILRTNIDFLNVDSPPKLVVVTSALPEEGKSTVVAGLAAAYALAGKRTLIVECDLRRPTLAGRLQIKSSPGLTDYLAGHATPQEVLQTIAPPSTGTNGNQAAEGATAVPLVALVAGSPAPQPAELLRSQRCSAFFAQVREAYDIVLVDTPPVLAVADTLELLPGADAVVVCVRASKTTRDQARAARAAMSHLPERPAGIVVTGLRAREEAYSYGYYSYGYVYGSSGS